VYYNGFQLKLRYEYSTTLISHKIKVGCTKNNYLNKLFGFLKIFGRLTTHKFTQIKISTPNYGYYSIVRLALRYEYPTTLVFLKTFVGYIRSCCFKQVV
jgi:hypothetical protein